MDSLVEPLGALLVIAIPLGLAYILVELQSRSKDQRERKSIFKRRCVKHRAR